MDWAVQQISMVFNKQSMDEQLRINTKINTMSPDRNQEIGRKLRSVRSDQLNLSKDESITAKCIELIMVLKLTIPLADFAKLCFLIQSKEDKDPVSITKDLIQLDIIYRLVIRGIPIDFAKTEFNKFDNWSMQ